MGDFLLVLVIFCNDVKKCQEIVSKALPVQTIEQGPRLSIFSSRQMDVRPELEVSFSVSPLSAAQLGFDTAAKI